MGKRRSESSDSELMKVTANVAHHAIDDVLATANALRIDPTIIRSSLFGVKDHCDRVIRYLDRVIDPSEEKFG